MAPLTTDEVLEHELKQWMVASYQPYVESLARKLARRKNDPVEDLIQVGLIGLVKAMEHFDPESGTTFKTYATYYITGEMRHYLRDKVSMIKAPRHIPQLYYRMNQLIAQLEVKLGRMPTDAELGEHLHCSTNEITAAYEWERRRECLSLDEFLHEEDTGELRYLEQKLDGTSQEALQGLEERIAVQEAVESLTPELQSVVQLVYYKDCTQTEAARQLGISQMQVSRRLKKALGVLSTRLKAFQANYG